MFKRQCFLLEPQDKAQNSVAEWNSQVKEATKYTDTTSVQVKYRTILYFR